MDVRIAGGRRLALLVGLLSIALTISIQWPGASAEPPPAQAPAPAASAAEPESFERPDSVSAMISARSLDERVEDLSQRDEDSRVFANPDGTWTSETAAEPERVRDADGEWHDIDTTLVEHADGYAAAHGYADVVISAGGDNTFATVTDGDRLLEWQWPSVLPEPAIEGSSATYPDVVDGGDLVVTATATGFSHDIVLRGRPSDPVTFTIPVATDGAKLVERGNGSLEVVAPSGEVLAEAPQPLMWDASTDSAGGPANVEVVDTQIGKTAAGTPTITLAPAAEFLADPDTVYPVVVDPSFTLITTGDTWVQNADYTSSQFGSSELRAGTYDGGGHKARSFMKFNANGAWTGKHIVNAKLTLRNWYSGSCTGANIRASRITEDWDVSTLTWANQPAVGTGQAADYAPAHGYNSSCAAAPAEWNIAGMVQDWADGTIANKGIRLHAVTETSSNTWRKYRSSEYGTERPRIDVTYNSYPNKAGKPTLTPGNTGYSQSLTPTLKSTVSDPDGATVKGRFEILNSGGTVIWTKDSTGVSSGGTATVAVPSGELSNGASYTARVKGVDASGLQSASWSTSYAFTVDTTAPTAPAVTATGFTNGQWTATVPASNTFTLNGVSDTATLSYQKDTGIWQTLAANSSGDATLSWLPTSGAHTLRVKAIDKAGNTGSTTLFSFGVGGLEYGAPLAAGRSTGEFPITLTGPHNSTGGILQWRLAGGTTWQDMDGVTTSTGSAWTGAVPNTGDVAAGVTGLRWDASAQIDPATDEPLQAPALLEIRGCFNYSGSPSQACSAVRKVQLVPSGFGGNMPATEVGPARVALTTGEFTLTETDAVDTAADVGRTFRSFDSATITDGPFGAGWSSFLAGSMTDASSSTVIDQRSLDGTFVLSYPDGSTQAFEPGAEAGVFVPVETEDDTRRLTLDVTTTPDTLSLKEDQGPTTVWELVGGQWLLHHVIGPEESGKTSYERDAQNRLVWIAQDAPTGVTCNQTTQQPGCRGLKIVYNTSGQVSRVDQIAYDPQPGADGQPGAGAGMTTVAVATYTYASGKLSSVCDPRIAAGFCTSYTYTTAGGRTLLETVAPPAQVAWRFGYDTEGRLKTVKRALDPETGSGDATWTVAHDVDLAAGGLPDMSQAATEAWGQTASPTQAAAVFGPSHVPPSSPGASDWPHAQLWYSAEDGTLRNTAVYGAGQWLVDTNWYDAFGNVVQTLDGPGRARALAADPADRATVALEASSLTRYNDDGDEDNEDGDGTRVVDEYSPVHTSTIENGTVGLFRSHVHYVYDDQAPTLDPVRPALPEGESSFGLVMEEQRSATNADMSTEYDTRLIRYEYSPNVAGDGNGWNLSSPTRTKVQTQTGWAVAVERFDSEGKPIETRQPGGAAAADGSGNDARSTRFIYYTADASAADPQCRNRPAWDGLTCRVGPAAQPSGAPMPVTYTLGFNRNLSPTRTEDRSGSTVRATVTGFDNVGRPTSQSQTVAGGNPADPTSPDVSTTYGSNGQLATQSSGGDTITNTYDSWGRIASYTDSTGLHSTTTYTADGHVAEFHDGAGLYTYTYDGPDEHRGVPISVSVGLPSGPDTFTLAYDAAGQQSGVTYPNGLVATRGYDELGIAVSLDYTTSTGENVLSFTATAAADGRVTGYASPASTQAFTYDHLGRLTKVEDTRDGGCTTRTYGFSSSSERTSLASHAPGTNGECQTTTPTSSRTNTYDAASRITNPGYGYDNLGRSRSVPAIDTAPGALGAAEASYYPSDMVASMTQLVEDGQGGQALRATTYELDPAGRIVDAATTDAGDGELRTRYRFASSGDMPSMVQESADGGNTWVSSRRLLVPGVGAAAEAVEGELTLWLSNLHGDVVAASESSGDPALILSYAETDEFGNAAEPGGTERYGWLGTAQRARADIGGFYLMGARVYNPATGMFLSTDAVLGGNPTSYAYPIDPINTVDLSGQMSFSRGSYTWKWFNGIQKRVPFVGTYRLGTAFKATNYTISAWLTPGETAWLADPRRGGFIGVVVGLAGVAVSFLPSAYGRVYAVLAAEWGWVLWKASRAKGRGMVITLHYMRRVRITPWFGWWHGPTATWNWPFGKTPFYLGSGYF